MSFLSNLENFFAHIGNRSTDIGSAIGEIAALGSVLIPVITAANPGAGAIAGVVETVLKTAESVTTSVGSTLTPPAAAVAGSAPLQG